MFLGEEIYYHHLTKCDKELRFAFEHLANIMPKLHHTIQIHAHIYNRS